MVMTESSSNMPNLTLGYGSFLIAWGIAASIISDEGSVTSLIPSFLGIPIAISGWMAKSNPDKRKFWMHIAVVFGLLCALGGTRFFMVLGDASPLAAGSMLMLLVSGTAYTALCVRSFIEARKAREASQQ